MHSIATNYVSVESGGDGVAAHVGLHALGALADRVGLGASLSSRIAPRGERLPLHDRGKVLTQMALVLAGGGESCADIEHLRIPEAVRLSPLGHDGLSHRPRVRRGPAHASRRGSRRGARSGVGEVRHAAQ